LNDRDSNGKEGKPVNVTAVRLTPDRERGEYAYLLPYIPLDKQARLARFRRNEDYAAGLMGELLVRTMVGEAAGLKNGQMHFEAGPHGKPRLSGRADVHFNLSHSGAWAVCVTGRLPVGIDVEKIGPIEREIAGQFFAQQEVAYLQTLPDDEAYLQAFYRFWTLKESYIKADGRGLAMGLDSFAFDFSGDRIVLDTSHALHSCHFRFYDCDPKYQLAVCAMTDDFPQELNVWNEDELIAHFMKVCR